MPLESGTSITAAAKPDGVTGVKWTLEAGTVAPAAGTKIDESTGVVTLDAKQPGGKMKPKATNGASFANAEFRVIEKPKDIASTTLLGRRATTRRTSRTRSTRPAPVSPGSRTRTSTRSSTR